MITAGRPEILSRARRAAPRAARALIAGAGLACAAAALAAPPIEFRTAFSGQTCALCHSPSSISPPNLPATSFIVPNGAAATSGSNLRTIMTNRGGMSNILTANNGLTDTILGTIRLYLIEVRDGALVVQAGSSTAFGSSNVNVAGSIQTFVITNERGVTASFVAAPSGSNAEFAPVVGGSTCGATLAALASCTVQMQFTPAAAGSRSGALQFTLNSPTSVTSQQRSITLTGTGITPPPPAALAISPVTSTLARATFSSRVNVTSASQTWTLSNSGSGSVTLGTLTPSSGDYLLGGTCSNGFVLPTTASTCTVTVAYRPGAEAAATDADITIANSTATPGKIYLRGTAIGDPVLQVGAVATAFPLTLVGHPVTRTVRVTNTGTGVTTTGTASFSAGAFSAGTGCNGAVLAANGGFCDVVLTFNPSAAGPNQSATLSVPYAPPAGASASRAFSASAVALASSPAVAPTLQSARPGSTSTTVQISNPSAVSTFLGPIGLAGSNNFQITSNTCGATLAGTPCAIGITFTPDTDNPVSTALSVRYGPSAGQSSDQLLSLTINGSTQAIAVITVNPASLVFPDTLPGAASTLSVDIGNSGSAALDLTSIALADNVAGDFAISANTCPASLATGAPDCRVSVTFTPSGLVARAARLVVTHNAAGGTTNVALSGATLQRPVASLSPTTLDFGAVVVANDSAALSSVLTNTGNLDLHLGTLTLAGPAAADYVQVGSTCLAGATVVPGSACQVTLRLRPSATGSRDATLQITHDAAASPSSIVLAGTGTTGPTPDVQTNQAALVFAPIPVQSTSAAQTVTLRNSGTANLVFSRLASTGANGSDFATSGTCSVATPLAPNASCAVNVAFTPLAAGARTAQLSIESNASRGTLLLPLSGTGLAQAQPALAITPATLTINFGPQTLGGVYAPGTIRLDNTGTAPLHIASIVASGAGFSASGSCGATLADGSACEVQVAFAPTAAGTTYAGQVVITSDAPGSPHTVRLSGSGTAAAVPVLVWSPAASALDFGNVAVGVTAPTRSLQLLNQGPGGITLQVVNAVGVSASDYSVTGTCLPASLLLQGASCRVDVSFVPGSAGAKPATLQVVASGTRPGDIQLTGNGLGGASASLAALPSALAFDLTRVGAQSLPLELTLSSTGSGAVRVMALEASGPYALQGKSCPSTPFTLPAGATCTLVLTFLPQAEGVGSGMLRVTTDAAPAVREVALSGRAEPKADLSSGGCSIASGSAATDPTLWLLVLLALAVLVFRRRGSAPRPHGSASRRDGAGDA